jgi:hypothetical protein
MAGPHQNVIERCLRIHQQCTVLNSKYADIRRFRCAFHPKRVPWALTDSLSLASMVALCLCAEVDTSDLPPPVANPHFHNIGAVAWIPLGQERSSSQ